MLTVEVTGLDALQKQVARWIADPLPPTAHVAAAGIVATVWQGVASGAVIAPMTRPFVSAELAGSIAVQPSDTQAIVTASGPMPTEPKAAWDMKKGLINGPHAKIGKHGRYNRIPMRPKSADVPDAAMTAIVMQGINQTVQGLQLTKLTPAGAYTWKSGSAMGLRIGMHPDHPVGPVTFRTVSERSPAASWWYPPRPGIPLLDAVWNGSRDGVTAVYTLAWVERMTAHD